MHFEAEVFVAVGFALFLGVLLKVGAHSKLFGALDARIDRVKDELAQAQKLRAEAEALFASFEKKRVDAEAEAAAIVAQAKSEAEMIAAEARKRLDEYVARGDKQIMDKIALAEAQAVAEVRAAAADAATKVAESVLRGGVSGGKDFVAEGIRQLGALAH
ncbi:MAG: ATP F0F1 synthase subunit B [Methylocystis sp.]